MDGLVLIVALIMTEMGMQLSILERKVSECGHAEGSAVSAVGGEVRPKLGRKSLLRHSPLITEADTVPGTPGQCG